MSLIIALGSNLGDKENHLNQAKHYLCQYFKLIACSRIYSSSPVEFLDQPYFYNQILEFETPSLHPQTILRILLEIEKKMGRERTIPKGPRTIDLDILFIDLLEIIEPNLVVPHPRWKERSFIIYPLKEIPFYRIIKTYYSIPKVVSNHSIPLQ